MGKNTYVTVLKANQFPFPDALNIVVASQPIENSWGEKVLVTDKSPREILALLEQKGFTTAFLAGGGKLNASFARENLIDEIYLDIEPLVLGQGIQIFEKADFEFSLKLIEMKKLNPDTVQLHYAVLKDGLLK